MDPILEQIATELENVASFFKTNDPAGGAPLNTQQNNWTHLTVPYSELSLYAATLAEHIKARGVESTGARQAELQKVLQGLTYFRTNSQQHLAGHPQFAPGLVFSVLESVERSVFPSLNDDQAIAISANRAAKRIRAIESRLREVEPKTDALSNMLQRIEAAHEAADQLPTDLESLREARETTEKLLSASKNDREAIAKNHKDVEELAEKIKSIKSEAEKILELSGSAYAAATSKGLAAAFSMRSQSLTKSSYWWIGGLITALALASYMGTTRISTLADILRAGSELKTEFLYANIIGAILSVGAPIWFAWLSTKQIGQNFRLSEDYAFKAAISQAYEGYRKEAARIGNELEAKLLGSALQRLDEQPLRLIEQASYGSPWHELMSSEEMRTAMKNIPGLPGRLIDFVKSGQKKD
jgi:hypothetical protein